MTNRKLYKVLLLLTLIFPTFLEAENLTVYPLTGKEWQTTIDKIGKITIANSMLQIISHSGSILYAKPLYETRTIVFGDILNSFSNLAVSNFRVYPNPACTTVHLDGVDANEQWHLFDQQGRLLQTGSNNEISVESLSTGVYFILCNGQIQKLIRQ